MKDPVMAKVEADLDRFFAALGRCATAARARQEEQVFIDYWRRVKDREPTELVIKALDEWATARGA